MCTWGLLTGPYNPGQQGGSHIFCLPCSMAPLWQWQTQQTCCLSPTLLCLFTNRSPITQNTLLAKVLVCGLHNKCKCWHTILVTGLQQRLWTHHDVAQPYAESLVQGLTRSYVITKEFMRKTRMNVFWIHISLLDFPYLLHLFSNRESIFFFHRMCLLSLSTKLKCASVFLHFLFIFIWGSR